MAQAAPTAVLTQSTSAASTTTLPSSTTAMTVADVNAGLLLAVFVAIGTTTALSTTTMNRFGALDTSWNLDVNTTSNSGAGTNRLLVFSKVLTSADLDGSNNLQPFGLTGYAGSGARFQLIIRKHADGWSTNATTRRVDALTASGASVSAGVTMFTPTNSPRASTCIIGFSSGLGSNGTITAAGTNSTGANPHFPTMGSASSGISTGNGSYQCDVIDLADSDNISTVSVSSGSANTTHANAFVQYVVQSPSASLPGAATTITASPFGRTKRVTLPGAAISASAGTLTRRIAGQVDGAALTVSGGSFGRTKRVTLPGAAISAGAASFAAPKILTGADVAISAGTFTWSKSATFQVGLSTPPKTTYPTRTLRCWAATSTTTGVGELKIALYQGATLITDGAWKPLAGTTATKYELDIAGTITDWTQLRAEVSARTTSSAIPRVFQVELELIDGIGGVPVTVTVATFGRRKTVTLPGAAVTVSVPAVTGSKSLALPGALLNASAGAFRQVVIRDIVLRPAGRVASRWSAGQPRN